MLSIRGIKVSVQRVLFCDEILHPRKITSCLSPKLFGVLRGASIIIIIIRMFGCRRVFNVGESSVYHDCGLRLCMVVVFAVS